MDGLCKEVEYIGYEPVMMTSRQAKVKLGKAEKQFRRQ
jgi:hypothetical protein